MIVMIGEWIQQADVWILLLIQEYLRADWMTGFWKAVTFFGKCRLVLDCDSCGFCSDPQNQESGIDSRFFSGCGSVDY